MHMADSGRKGCRHLTGVLVTCYLYRGRAELNVSARGEEGFQGYLTESRSPSLKHRSEHPPPEVRGSYAEDQWFGRSARGVLN